MRIGIVGMGLIGTSISLAARRAWPDAELIAIDRGETLDKLAGADVVVLATPVDVILDLIRDEHERLRDAVVIDTGSTKRAIVEAARDAGLAGFVGGHPMAGAAAAGPDGARVDLFDRRPWFLVPHRASADARDRAQVFVTGLGAVPVIMDDDGTRHDRVMAAVSHLPQVVASVLMTVVGDTTTASDLAWSGAGLRDTTRLAASPASMWAAILATNADELQPLLTRVAGDLRALADKLDDPEVVARLFEQANHHRARIEQARRGPDASAPDLPHPRRT